MVTSLQNLCQSLVESDSEQETIQILKKADYWNVQENWKFYGNNENNFSVIGNQGSVKSSVKACPCKKSVIKGIQALT